MTRRIVALVSIFLAVTVIYQFGRLAERSSVWTLIGEGNAQETSKPSPVKARARDFYAPNTEDLRPDEIRLIACGTGMPTARPKQAASCWLFELGNGEKFLFDLGTGSAERIAALQIPYNYLNKVFLSHLHTDHFGDLDALFISGALGRSPEATYAFGAQVVPTPEHGHEIRSGPPDEGTDLGLGWTERTHRSTRLSNG